MSEDRPSRPRNLAKKTHEMLMGLSHKDSLTGLLNRRGWDERVSEHKKIAERTGQAMAFLVMDLDDLKILNDETKSHEAGDKLIQGFADALKSITRSSDVVARIGGDEFAICMFVSDLSEAVKLKDRLIETCDDIRVSIGIGKDFSEADSEMYKIKRERKNG